jgi:hypothetical protein
MSCTKLQIPEESADLQRNGKMVEKRFEEFVSVLLRYFRGSTRAKEVQSLHVGLPQIEECANNGNNGTRLSGGVILSVHPSH